MNKMENSKESTMSRCVPTGLSAGAASSCLAKAKVPKKQHPHEVEVTYRNPEELMQEYLKIAAGSKRRRTR